MLLARGHRRGESDGRRGIGLGCHRGPHGAFGTRGLRLLVDFLRANGHDEVARNRWSRRRRCETSARRATTASNPSRRSLASRAFPRTAAAPAVAPRATSVASRARTPPGPRTTTPKPLRETPSPRWWRTAGNTGSSSPLAAARVAYAIAQGNADPRDADALVRVNFPRGVAPGAWLDEHAHFARARQGRRGARGRVRRYGRRR